MFVIHGKMKTNISLEQLFKYVVNQCDLFFPDGRRDFKTVGALNLAWERLGYCFSHIKLKYFQKNGSSCFNYLHGDQYCMFLYFFSNSLYKEGNERGAQKIFLLNKMMFGIDAFYSIKLPDIFYFCHPLGTILGNANYGDFMAVYQGVTVGSDRGNSGQSGVYPTFGEGCILLANSTVIGETNIGDNVILSAGSYVRNRDITQDTVVFGSGEDNIIKENRRNNKKHYFNV